MDKSLKLEPKDSKEQQILLQTSTESPPPSPSSQSPHILVLSPNDDDSITTSTESSDTFEAWTLVMDKQKLKDENRVEIVRDISDHEDEDEDGSEEVEETEEEKGHDKELLDSSNDNTTDDLSDGISIISESESNGRLSPHPYLRDHLQDLNLKFTTAQRDDDEIINRLIYGTLAAEPSFPSPAIVPDQQQQIRQRPGKSSTESTENKDKALQKSSQTVAEPNNFPPVLKRGLQGIFYIGVALAILGLIGKIRNPTWQPLAGAGSNSPSAVELEQKVSDMELQNNLMRAEIDLLNKQVKYLNSLNEHTQQKRPGKYKGQYEDTANYREGKTFKAWSGNGESLRPVDITKEDLKRAYKCPDGSLTEFAGMCVEKNHNEPNIVEQFEQVVDDFKQQSETMQAFEKMAQELHGFTEGPFDQVKQILKESGHQEPAQQEESLWKKTQVHRQPNEFIKNKPIYPGAGEQEQQEYQHRPSASLPFEFKDNEKCKDSTDTKCFENEFKKQFDAERKDFRKTFEHLSKERLEKFKYAKNERKPKFDRKDSDEEDDSAERFNRRRNDSKERHQKRNDERFAKRDDDSNERLRKRDNDSKERINKRSKENSSRERFQKQKPIESGEWQEQYMKHRESSRKQNEQKFNGDNKNWYIKRGDGRENKRNADIRLR